MVSERPENSLDRGEHTFYCRGMAVSYREEPCNTALNPVKGMPFRWSLNPYMGCVHRCTYCYVRSFEQRADRPSDDRYGASIRVKTNVVAVLRHELSRRTWSGDGVVIGAATDPYQPAEGRYRLTRGCLEALADHLTPTSLITRGPLIVRDIDVLAELARRVDLTVAFSIPTLDREAWLRTEPGTAPPHQRLRALRTLVDAGIKASVGMAPILPGITDKPELLAAVVRAARDAGACGIWAAPLHLKPGTREHVLECLARDWPEQLPEYERLYAGRAYLPAEPGRQIRESVRALAREHGVRDRRSARYVPDRRETQLTLPL